MRKGQLKIHYVNPYPVLLLQYVDEICQTLLMRPCRLFFDQFLSSFFPTTLEVKNIFWWRFKRISVVFISIGGTLTLLPIFITGWLIWLSIQWIKEPYRLSICQNKKQSNLLLDEKNIGGNLNYRIATTNLCLLPEFLCRFNNQTSPELRAKLIGERIVHSQILKENKQDYQNGYSSVLNSKNIEEVVLKKCAPLNGVKKHVHFERQESLNNNIDIEHSVLTEFPKVDILFVQETWVKDYAEVLTNELHACFPYIVYDAGVYSWKSNYFLTNSGTMIASKYPILNVKFDWYRNSTSQCKTSCKGLLQVKVLLGETNGKKLVGYVYNTHLQVYQGSESIHSSQMDDIVKWSKLFRSTTLCKDEVVLFDVLGGDFNVDNMSPADRDVWYHPVYSIYKDACRKQPGEDYEWAVGTEMRHTPLHDALIQTPTGLKQALEDPKLLAYYVLDATVEVSDYSLAWMMPEHDANGDQKVHSRSGKRRIDFLMPRRTDEHVHVSAMNPVTQLAGLTDHIPYCMTIGIEREKLQEILM